LCLHLCAHSWEAQEDAIQGSAGGIVDVNNRATNTSAFQLIKGFACPAKQEKNENYITESIAIQNQKWRRNGAEMD
jgi:hypothetical protein